MEEIELLLDPMDSLTQFRCPRKGDSEDPLNLLRAAALISVAERDPAMRGDVVAEAEYSTGTPRGTDEACKRGGQKATEKNHGSVASSEIKDDPQAPGWARRVRIGCTPLDMKTDLLVYQSWSTSK